MRSGGTGFRYEDRLPDESVRGDGAAGKLVAVAASGPNLDRLVSCVRAARRAVAPGRFVMCTRGSPG